MRVVQIAILVLFAVVCCRLGQIQIIQSQKYRSLAQKQYQANVILPAPRGFLFDRNGNSIASNTTTVSFGADPQGAGDDERTIAEVFSNLFGKPRKFYLDKLQSDSRFVWLERGADAGVINKIDLKRLPGIVVRNEPKRLYYHDHIAGQLIGTTDVDNKGVAGVELAFDKELSGRDGYVVFQRDGLGHARPSVDYPRVEPESGHNVVLTIDMGFQAIAEKELKKGITENKADGGIVVILQPKTGEVLAIA
ncbi:MAG TPA: peptidoglycan glycosyltransferase, partial [Bacteroidota bacterium]|nr:peptidoglycan glycosyltransferase [Bacteroidota bacterium]